MKVLLDSNILIDFLNGSPDARAALERWPDAAISVVTTIEVLAGARDDAEAEQLKLFMQKWPQAELSAEIAEAGARIRRTLRLRLADAVILATARVQRRQLVTRNTKDFRPDWPDVVVPYTFT